MKKEYPSTKSKIPNLNNKISQLLAGEFFFSFLVILFIILIYGLFQKDPGFGFFGPYWKKLDLILGVTIFFGILAVFWGEE